MDSPRIRVLSEVLTRRIFARARGFAIKSRIFPGMINDLDEAASELTQFIWDKLLTSDSARFMLNGLSDSCLSGGASISSEGCWQRNECSSRAWMLSIKLMTEMTPKVLNGLSLHYKTLRAQMTSWPRIRNSIGFVQSCMRY